MQLKIFLSFISVLLLFSLFLLYFIPWNSIDFSSEPSNSNFTLSGEEDMQFYPNLRYRDSNISYNITDCQMQKRDDAILALEIIENLTDLTFYPVNSNQQIWITCEDKNLYSEGLFVAGEGGPSNVTYSGNFNVITKGEVLLLRKSTCTRPNVATHEILHALGFKHSTNPENILSNVTECNQRVSQDLINKINDLYVIPSFPDLVINNISGKLDGRFLNIEVNVNNYGLNDAEESQLMIIYDNRTLKTMNLSSMKIGTGRFIGITNLWIQKFGEKNITVLVQSNFTELDKNNNQISLEIKK